jgi:hypothetical protein
MVPEKFTAVRKQLLLEKLLVSPLILGFERLVEFNTVGPCILMTVFAKVYDVSRFDTA